MAHKVKHKFKRKKTRKNALKDIKRIKKNEEVIKRLRESQIISFPDFSESIDKNTNNVYGKTKAMFEGTKYSQKNF